MRNIAEDTQQLCHERSGRNNKIDIRKLSKQTQSLTILDKESITDCDICNTQKARRSPLCQTGYTSIEATKNSS